MLVCLDYDGVIVDSFDTLLELSRAAHAGVGSGRAPQAEDFRRIEDLSFDALAERLGVDAAAAPAYARAVLELQRRPGAWRVPLVPGMAQALATLAARQHRLVVITAGNGTTVERSLAELGVAAHIHAVLGGETRRTKAERIAQAMHEAGCAAARTWMVGDAISDIRQGKAAGVCTAAVSWGYQDGALLRREAPDRLLGHPDELLELARQ